MPKRKRKPRHRPRPPLNFDAPILRSRSACAFVGYGQTEFFKKVKAGLLPQPIKLSDTGRAVGWIKKELEAWLAARIAKRDEEAEMEARQ